eukprot:gene14134-15611_t
MTTWFLRNQNETKQRNSEAVSSAMEGADINNVLASVFCSSQTQDGQREPLRLIIATEDNFLAWIEDKKQLLVISLKHVQQLDDGPKSQFVFQKLSCSQTFPFEVKHLDLNVTGEFLSLTGENGVGVMEMPRQWGRTSLYVGGKQNIICRSVMLAEDFFRRKFNLKVLQTAWFPENQNDILLIMLTSDNCLRCFDVRSQIDIPISTINLFNSLNSSSSSSSLTSFQAALGEMAVSFSFAPSLPATKHSVFHPMFIVQENGDTWALWTRVIQNRLLVEQRGPLVMTPQAEDNYAGEFCSMLCLDTSPPIVVLATTTGCIHHCIALESEKTGNNFEDAVATPKTGTRAYLHDWELFVYETVQLELGFVGSEQKTEGSQEDERLNEKLQICKDPSTVYRYFCVSSAGVHMINLPWTKDLEHFFLPDTAENQSEWEIASPAEINYILCTKPTENSSPYRILGISTTTDMKDGTSFLCLLDNGELVKRTIGIDQDTEAAETWDESFANNSLLQLPSPLKRLKAAGSFEDYIKKIIKRNSDAPILKAPSVGDQPLSPEEAYELLTQAVGILRKEYIQKFTTASQEIKKRSEILKSHKEQQASDLSSILNDHELSENAEALADKLLTVSEKLVSLTKRLDDVVHAVQSSAPVLSDAEREWQKECVTIQQKAGNLRRCVEGIRNKHENLVLSKVPRSQQNRSSASQANPAQLSKIKVYMQEQNNKIAELVERLRNVDMNLQT